MIELWHKGGPGWEARAVADVVTSRDVTSGRLCKQHDWHLIGSERRVACAKCGLSGSYGEVRVEGYALVTVGIEIGKRVAIRTLTHNKLDGTAEITEWTNDHGRLKLSWRAVSLVCRGPKG